MLYSLFTLFSLVTLSFSLKRHFTPSTPGESDWHDERVWMWLNRECFSSESDVLLFKDTLLSNYDCLSYGNREKVFFCGENESQWSLWLELDNKNKECLSKEIEIINLDESCITHVIYEPLEHIQREFEFELKDITSKLINRLKGGIIDNDGISLKQKFNDLLKQPTCYTQSSYGGFSATQLRTLDYMDGTIDGVYRTNSDANNNVGAIILDTGVDLDHVEFTGSETTQMYGGNIVEWDHGTHVCGTVCGVNMGNAKGNTPIWNYPVCNRGDGSCEWNAIEAGYEAAVNLMESTANMRFVINYSVGGSKTIFNTGSYDSWGNRILAANGLWVTSAGNSASDACNFAPAYSSAAFTVGSMSISASTGALTPTTWFTNYGSCVDVWSGGENVMSSLPENAYGTASGTSMASPQICGLVINILRDYPDFTQAQVLSYLRSNSNPINTNSATAPNNYASYYNGCN